MSENSNKPVKLAVKAGKTYYWCACGKSARQPFCDGSHNKIPNVPVTPLAWEAEKDDEIWFCVCKKTGRAPFCDGTHKRLA